MEKTPNFHDLSEEKRQLREIISDDDESSRVKDIAKKTLDEAKIDANDFIKNSGGLLAAKEKLKSDKKSSEKSVWLDEVAIIEEIPAYADISSIKENLADLKDFEMRRLREAQNDPYARKTHERLAKTIHEEKTDLESKLSDFEKKDPPAVRATELVEYKKGLHAEGHIVPTPSVRENLDKIGLRMITGKPMFLHGPTGTGKTSLARFAAKHFTGESAEIVYCNPQTRETNIWGKTGIRPARDESAKAGAIETFNVYGPLARAMKEGKTVVFDEFTALPREQMVFIKGVFNAKTGDSINVVGNGTIEIAPGFQMIFTANLKSEKNPERQELPPEIAREFEQNNLKISYTPKEEAYDIMLARLMNPDGSLDMSKYDLDQTLPKLCEAMEEIQVAYTDKTRSETAIITGTKDVAGKVQGLKKFVMTQGTIEAMLESWTAEKRMNNKSASFAEFIDGRLATGLTFEEYSLQDRILAAKILASKGFLTTFSAEKLGLPKDTFDFDAAKKSRGSKESAEKLAEESGEIEHISLADVALLDPFKLREQKMKDRAMEFLAGAPETVGQKRSTEATLEEIKAENETFLKQTFEKWYDKTRADTTEQIPIIIDPRDQDFTALKDNIIAEKFGEYTVNPEMRGLDFENWPKEKIKMLNLADMQGKLLHEVAKHIVDTYGDTHHIPGIEFWKWMIDSYERAPDDVKEKYKKLKDGNYYFNFGSLVRNSGGRWSAPYSRWHGSSFSRGAYRLGYGWDSDFRVVLLEK